MQPAASRNAKPIVMKTQQVQLSQLWLTLTQPKQNVRDPQRRKYSQWLAGLILVLTIGVVPLGALPALTTNRPLLEDPQFFGAVAASICHLIAYYITRKGHYETASVILVIAGSLNLFAITLTLDEVIALNALYYLVVPLLFSSLFITQQLTLLLFGLQMSVLILFIQPHLGIPSEVLWSGPLAYHITMTLLVMLGAYFRRRMDRFRLQQIAESEERYRIISELMSDYAYAYRVESDQRLIYEWGTDSFERVTGYSWDEINAAPEENFLFDEETNSSEAELARILQNQAVTHEYHITTPSGSVKWLRLHRRPIWDAQQKRVVRIYGVAQDITDRKLAERERLQSTVQNERNLLLKNFVNSISHDFRTSLAVINSSAFIIRRRLSEEQVALLQPKFDNLETQVQRMAEQIANLDTITTLLNLHMRRCDLNAIVEAAHLRHAGQISEKQLSSTLTLQNPLPVIEGDADELQRTLEHVIRNAVNYTAEGGEIHIKTYAENGHVHVEIADTGIGIAAEHLPHIFDLFYRVDPARQTQLGGIGVGLNIVKMIVEAHGGTVSVASTPDQGSTFTIALPVK